MALVFYFVVVVAVVVVSVVVVVVFAVVAAYVVDGIFHGSGFRCGSARGGIVGSSIFC